MDVKTTVRMCGSGLVAQRTRLEVAAENLTNVTTTRTPEGGPYKRKVVTLAGEDVYFRNRLDDAVKEVKVDAITASNEGFKAIHDPTHPDADASGNVLMPNVEVMKEMVDMLTAARAYEAVATAFDATKNMALKTLDLGK